MKGVTMIRAAGMSDECASGRHAIGFAEVDSFFFFQAEDGIRDYKVTGVQTCGLPILSRVAIGGRRQRLEGARSVVPLGVRASGRATAGTTTVAAAVRPWERLSKPAHVSWFVPGSRTSVVAEPAAGSRVTPLAPLTLTFARPVASLPGSRLPPFEPALPGRRA